MLIQYFSFFVFVLSTFTWASFIDVQESIDDFPFGHIDQLQFAPFINEALSKPEILSRLSSSSRAILTHFSLQNERVAPFYNFVLKNYDFHNSGFDSEDPYYWNALISRPFRIFSRQQAEQAEVIINQIVLPHHPFLSQTPFRFQTSNFLAQPIPDIDFFLDQAAKNIFDNHFSQILALENSSEAQILFRALLRKAKYIFCYDLEYKYHHAFLANVPFHYFKRAHLPPSEHYFDISSYISNLAPVLYRAIAEHSKPEVEKILVGIVSSRYLTFTESETETTYENIISKCQESSQQPIDHSYLWDPKLFSGDLLDALQNPENIVNSHFAPYLTILEFIFEDSPLAYLFRHYIVQNFPQPLNLIPEEQYLFWGSLMLSSFSDFSSLLPNHSYQIIQLLFPSMYEIKSLFLRQIVENRFSSDVDFLLLASWGHTLTVQLILECRTDISAYDAGWALRKTAQRGHAAIIETILQRRNDISAIDAGWALCNAAQNGHTVVVEILLQRRDDISAVSVGSALGHAAQGGHVAVIEILLQRRNDFSAKSADWALRNAAQGGHVAVIEILLQRRNDFSANSAGWALLGAAQGGHAAIIDLLLKSRTDISTDHVCMAIRSAVECGHNEIVAALQANIESRS